MVGNGGVERFGRAFWEEAKESAQHDEVGIHQVDGVAEGDTEILRLVLNGFRRRLAYLRLQATGASAVGRYRRR